jgi:YbbR domain-containing protein
MRMRLLHAERPLLLLLSFLIAATTWFYVKTTQYPRIPLTTDKVVAVIPDINGEPAYGYSLLGVRVAPPTVVISGRPEDLALIENLRTEPVVVTGATRDVVKDVALVGPPEGTRAIRVRVAVQVVPAIVVRDVAGVRLRVQKLPRGLTAHVEPATVNVQVQGPVVILNKLRPDDLVARIDATDFAEGRRRVSPDVQAPSQVLVISASPPVVVIVIRKGG